MPLVTDSPIVLAAKADQRSSQCPRSPVPALSPPARGSSAAPAMADPQWRPGAQDGSCRDYGQGQAPVRLGWCPTAFKASGNEGRDWRRPVDPLSGAGPAELEA